jgi:hypothetical protein
MHCRSFDAPRIIVAMRIPGKGQEPPDRIILAMPAKLIQRIDEYRWRERIASRAAAIRALLEIALKHVEPKKPP